MMNFNIQEKTYVNNNSFSLSCNLEFQKCGLVLLKGDNGSGKTTLLNILGLLDFEFSGSFEIGEINYFSDKKDIEKFRQNNFGYVGSIGFNNSNNTNLIVKASDGEKLFFETKKVLSQDKSIFILDEITSPLDNNRFSEIRDLIIKKKSHSLIFLATHDYRLINDADEIIELDNGRIINHQLKYKENKTIEFTNKTEKQIHNKTIAVLFRKISLFFVFTQAIILALGIFSSLYFALLFPRYDILESEIKVGNVYQIQQATPNDLTNLMEYEDNICFPASSFYYYDNNLEDGLYCDNVSAQEYFAIYNIGDIVKIVDDNLELKSVSYKVPGCFIGNKSGTVNLVDINKYGIYIKNNYVRKMFIDVLKSHPNYNLIANKLYDNIEKISFAEMLTKDYFYQSFLVVFFPIEFSLIISLIYFSKNLVLKESDFVFFNRLNGELNISDMKKIKIYNFALSIAVLLIGELILLGVSYPFYRIIFNFNNIFSSLNFYWIASLHLIATYAFYYFYSTYKISNLQFKKVFIRL